MAVLLIVPELLTNEPYHYLGDIIGVFADNHPFTDNEKDQFNFLTINGSKEDVDARLRQIQPHITTAFLFNGSWQLEEPVSDPDDEKEVWTINGGKNWYNLVSRFKFPSNIIVLTPEEKQLLETFDINHPSVDSAIKKIVKDLVAANPDNGTEERDLKNVSP